MSAATFDYRKGMVINDKAPPSSTEAKAPYIDYGTGRISPELYSSKELHALEWERMWTKVWTLAGFACDIPKVGDYFKYDLGRESFIVVRSTPSKIRAFYNVCPHRGNQLLTADFGTINGAIKCSFHGWRFGLDGANVEVRDRELFRPQCLANPDDLKLTEVACDIWNGLVFISMNPHPEPLLQYLGVVPEHLKPFRLDLMRPYSDTLAWLDANWKLNMDAFLEFYHAWDVHPEVNPFIDAYRTQYDCFDKGIGRMLMPYGYASHKLDDPQKINAGLEYMLRAFGGNPDDYKHLSGTTYRPAIIEVKRKFAKRNGLKDWDDLADNQLIDDWNYSIFPNTTLNVFADVCYVQRWRPHPTDPEKSSYSAISLNRPVPQDKKFQLTDLAGLSPDFLGPVGWDGSIRPQRLYPKELKEFGFVLEQDARLVSQVQKGATSRAFKGYILSEQEVRIRHYLAELDRYLRNEK
jgi:phenylpropionate dioxygenase-like ring-hydroxylating dioxygenase large terminal subunit